MSAAYIADICPVFVNGVWGFAVWAARRCQKTSEKLRAVNIGAWNVGFASRKCLQSPLVGTVAVRRICLTYT